MLLAHPDPWDTISGFTAQGKQWYISAPPLVGPVLQLPRPQPRKLSETQLVVSHLFQVDGCLQGRSGLNATSGLTCLDACPLWDVSLVTL